MKTLQGLRPFQPTTFELSPQPPLSPRHGNRPIHTGKSFKVQVPALNQTDISMQRMRYGDGTTQ